MNRPTSRPETRKERYAKAAQSAVIFPTSVATVNFRDSGNVSFAARATAVLGGHTLHVIGSLPEHNEFRRLSAGNCDLIKIKQYSNPYEFLKYIRNNNIYLISMELTDNSQNLYTTKIPLNQEIVIVCGNEETGVPTDLLLSSDLVLCIPNVAQGYSLNTSQCINITLAELLRRRMNYVVD